MSENKSRIIRKENCYQVYRTTPLGREVTDLLLAVNRSHNTSDYIPCITWGRNAQYTKQLPVGNNIKI